MARDPPVALAPARAAIHPARMGTVEHTLEIPRDRVANAWKLAAGAFALVLAIGLATDGGPWLAIALFGAIGAPTVAINAWALATGAPQLRATTAGVWFGQGPTIPWREIGL